MVDALAEPEVAPPGPAAAVAAPTTSTTTASSMVDLKGLARPEKFDGTDEHWLEWKSSFRSVMNLLDITPYLNAIEHIPYEIIYERCAPHE
eukprot:8251526-Heterocapsa_arctica.AAC.1